MKAIVAYIPSLHRGYINFFREHQDGSLYVLSEEIIGSFPKIERDIRALSSKDVAVAIESLHIFKEVSIFSEENLDSLKEVEEIVMPDEDISHQIADMYLRDRKVVFSPVFLRWDKLASIKKYNISPDTEISEEQFDKGIMAEASAEAEHSMDWWRQIGAIILKEGREIARGHNRHLPKETTPYEVGDPRSNFDAGENIHLSTAIHAEAGLIAEAARRGESLEGATIYVTTFPCPNCAKLIAASGIKRVYYQDGYSLLDAESLLKYFNIEIIKVSKESTLE